jgi:hypothetical protein
MRRRLWLIVLGILATVVVLLLFAAWPGSSTFTVGTETTYVTGPLDKHGYIDYVAALNERLREGVTPENNANVLIWQALGPHPEGAKMHAEYFQWLGIESPPEQGEYLVSWQKYLKEQPKLSDSVEREADGTFALWVPSRPWTAKEKPELAGWLKRNEKPLALAIEATRRPGYYNPLVPKRTEDWSPGLVSALLPTVQKCRELAAALVCRAMFRVAEGKVDDAWQDLLACHRLARLVARGGCLIELLVGHAIEFGANSGDLGFLDLVKLPSKQVSACWEDLRNLPPMPAVADKIDLGERFMILENIMSVARHGTPYLEHMSDSNSRPPKDDPFTSRLFSRSINWDPALRNANRWFDRCGAILRITDRAKRGQELVEFDRDLWNLKQPAPGIGTLRKWLMSSEGRGEITGNVMISLLWPAFMKVQESSERREQYQRNLSLAFALAAYQRDKGRYPAKLDDLIPAYLKTIPNDLFSDEPLIYRPMDKGYLLYSVGLNGIDEDGRGYGDEPRGDDLSVRMPVPQRRGKR